MATKREWLAAQGLAIAGARGKFSNAAKEAVAKAEADGMTFDDVTPVKPAAPKPVTSTGEPAKPAAPKPVGVTDYLFPSDFRFPEAEYKAVEVEGKREHSMRECCNTCRVSLTNHMCESPSVHGNRVKIVAR